MDDGENRIFCKICRISLNSKSQVDQHNVGRVHLNKLKEKGIIMDSSDQNNASNNSSSTGLSYCSVCSVSLEPHTSSEHFESRTHLNRCLQKGVGISLVPGSTGIKEGERSSTWCSICNHALESVALAEEHYESRAHLNKCLQRGVGIPLTYAAASPPCAPLPAGPRFSQAGGATSPGVSQFPPPGAGVGGGFRQGITGAQFKPRPRLPFTPNTRPTFGAKKFPIQPFVRGPTQSNARMSGQYSGGGSGGMGGSMGGSGGYGHQEMRSPDGFNQYEPTWQQQQQNQSSMKTNWPYCDTCEQSFPTVGLLSQHCNSSSHMEMKLMKQQSHQHQQQQQQQYHSSSGGPSQQGMGDQSRFYQGTTGGGGHGGRGGGGGMQMSNQGQYYGNQGGGQQDHYRGANTQNQGGGGHYAAKEWRPFNRNSQFLS